MAKAEWAALSLTAAAAGVLALATATGRGTAGMAFSAILKAALYMLLAAAAFRAAKANEGRLRLAWQVMSASMLGALLYFSAALGVAIVRGPTLPPSALVSIFLVLNAGALAATILLAPPFIRARSLWRFLLDAGIVGSSLFFVLWYVQLRGAFAASGLDDGQRLLTVMYPVLDVLALSTALLIAAFVGFRLPTWYKLLLAGTALVAFTDLTSAAGNLVGNPYAPVLADGGFLLSLTFLWLAARRSEPWGAKSAWARGEAAMQWVPYLPFAAAMLVVPIAYLDGGLDAPLLAAALVAIICVVARTLVLLSENRVLAQELRRAADFKTQLLRFISHEVANPLTPLAIETARLKDKDLDASDGRSWAVVQRSLARLQSLSYQVRALALADTGRLTQETVPAGLLGPVQDTARAHEAVLASKGLEFRLELPPKDVAARLDAERFGQVLDNLMSNAIKFTTSPGTVTLRLSAQGESAVVEVQDTGSGLTAEQEAGLFRAFGRMHGGRVAGLGLGLYLSRSIVDAHGGAITAHSEGPGKGTTFRITLPRVALPVAASAPATPVGAAGEKGPEEPAPAQVQSVPAAPALSSQPRRRAKAAVSGPSRSRRRS